jgi:hypothetical protein
VPIAAALLPRARGLDGRVEREQVGLLGDLGHLTRHAADLAGAAFEIVHRIGDGVDRAFDRPDRVDQRLGLAAPFPRPLRARRGGIAHPGGATGDGLDGRRHLLDGGRRRHGGFRLARRAVGGLPAGQIDLLGALRDLLGPVAHHRHQFGKPPVHP